MKKVNPYPGSRSVLLAGVLWFFGIACLESCKKEDIHVFSLISVSSGGIDLMTSSPTGVPVNAVISAVFSTNIDPNTLKDGITLTRDYDTTNVVITLILTKGIVTIRSNKDLTGGAGYTLKINSALHSSQGVPIQPFSTSFRTAGSFVPDGLKAYWNFEGNADDVFGTYDPAATDNTLKYTSYVTGRSTVAGLAAHFNGTTDIVQVANGTSLLGSEFTISLWMKLESAGHVDGMGNQKGSFVFGLGNVHGLQFDVEPTYQWIRFSHGVLFSKDSLTTTDFRFYGNGLTFNDLAGQPDSIRLGIDNATTVNQPIGSAGIRNMLDNQWAHVAFTFDGAHQTRALYLNGELMYKQQFSLLDTTMVPLDIARLFTATSLKFVADKKIPPMWDDKLAFGFWQGNGQDYIYSFSNPDTNHFQGLLDDIRIFSRSLSPLELSAMYQDEKP